MSQASVNIICRPSARAVARPPRITEISNFAYNASQAPRRVHLYGSWSFVTASHIQVPKAFRFSPRVRCRTVSLARTLVVPSQTELLAVSLQRRLTLDSGSSGSSSSSQLTWLPRLEKSKLTHISNASHSLLALLKRQRSRLADHSFRSRCQRSEDQNGQLRRLDKQRIMPRHRSQKPIVTVAQQRRSEKRQLHPSPMLHL